MKRLSGTAAGKVRGFRRHEGLSVLVALGLSLVTDAGLSARADDGSRVTGGASERRVEYAFNAKLLKGSLQGMDLTRFEQGMTVPPGRYELDVLVNGQAFGRETVTIGEDPEGTRLCLSLDAIKRLPLKPAAGGGDSGRECVDLAARYPYVDSSTDSANMRLELSVPQAYLRHRVRGKVPAEAWQDGINGAFVRYNSNAFRGERDGQESREDYRLGINAGVNLGGWQLRHNASLDDASGETAHYHVTNTYLRHDVTPWQADLVIGEYQTSGMGFESIPFTGVQLASDDAMLPPSRRGYAPVVRGTARTNARVTVRQGEDVIYETSVTPGPFAIDDLYATNVADDLEVTITEADGSERAFVLPYTSVAQLLRPGAHRFHLTLGEYRDDGLVDLPRFVQAEYRRGVSNRLTLYSGAILAEDYMAGLAGGAVSTLLGAFALDATMTRANHLEALSGEPESPRGESFRVSYNTRFDPTDTELSVVNYRFSSQHYLSLSDVALLRDDATTSSPRDRERQRLEVNLTQTLAGGTRLFASGISADYWDREDATTYQVGVSRGFSWGTLSATAGRSETEGDYTNEFYLNLSVPLGGHLQLTSNLAHRGDHRSGQLNLSGDSGALNYGVYVNHSRDDRSHDSSYGGNLGMDTSRVRLGLNLSAGDDYRSYSASADGTAIAYAGGLVLTRDQGETMAVIEAPGAKGAAISQHDQVLLDGRGKGAISGLTPYRYNRVALDPSGMTDGVEIKGNARRVAPRRGAIVRLTYDTLVGAPTLVRVTTPAPFGAQLIDADGDVLAVLGQGRMAVVRGIDAHRGYQLRWGPSPRERCRLTLEPQREATPHQGAAPRIAQRQATCLPGDISSG